jgi:RNA polymerase sigma factor (sigma-70 family)
MRRRRGATLEEIEAVYRRRLPEFRRVAAAIAGDRERGRDAVQEAFVSAVRARETFRAEAPLEAWLWRIVVRSANAARRDDALPASPSPNGHPQEPDRELRATVALLPERERLVLFLRYYADLDYATIAELTGITSGTVGATLNSARQRLRSLLAEAER